MIVRGLDQAPKLQRKFRGGGDAKSADFLLEIERDELTHVACGLKWFLHECKMSTEKVKDPVETFHSLVRKHFAGYLLPPFNHAARREIGMTEEWYMPLTKGRA